MGPRRVISNKADVTDRRKSLYLKRLESDLVLSPSKSNSPISRRTRRQSMYKVSTAGNQGKLLSKTTTTTLPSKKEAKHALPKSKSTSVHTNKLEKETKDSTSFIATKNFYKKPKQTGIIKKAIIKSTNVDTTKPKEYEGKLKSYPVKSTKEVKGPATNRKPLKRLTEASPQNQLPPKRVTRLSAKKNRKSVHISAKSPSHNEKYKKTPINQVEKSKAPKINNYSESPKLFTKISVHSPEGYKKQVSVRKLNPFTPKPDEPSKILKQSLKRNVESELLNLATREEVLKTPSKVDSSFRLSSYAQDSPVSSRKSTKSVRSSRNSFRVDDSDEKSFSRSILGTPLSSTPKGSEKRPSTGSLVGNMKLMELSGVTNSEESDLSQSLDDSCDSSMENSGVEENAGAEQPRRGFCLLM